MYKVSVVTPFHNVDMGMFQKCADSMRGQTLGFENIEWIIVVHNSKPHYLPLLIDMFKDDKNVIIKELHDDFHSPASPRNHGMQFLDTRRIADMFDYITTHCDELIADDSDIFETLPSKSFHEYQTQNDNNTATLLSTDTKPGDPYQLVVTNSAGLYRYVTDHIVCIKEKQIDKILFTIY